MSDSQEKINRFELDVTCEPLIKSVVSESLEDIVDLSVLLSFEEAQCEDEPDLIVELIDLYLTDVSKQLFVMKNSISKADVVSLKRAAHTVKGSSANLGMKAIATLCQEIEQTDFSESFQQSDNIIKRFNYVFMRVQSILLTERQSRDQITK
jgi:HPt (histidine-containing phosphotransfer) domain-containing protein